MLSPFGLGILFLATSGFVSSQDIPPLCGSECIQSMENLYFRFICVTGECDCSVLGAAPGGPFVQTCVSKDCSSQNSTSMYGWYSTLCGSAWPSSFAVTLNAVGQTDSTTQSISSNAAAGTTPIPSFSISTPSSSPSSTSQSSPKPLPSSSLPTSTQATSTSSTGLLNISTSSSSTSSPSITVSASSKHSLGLSTGASIGIGIGITIAAIAGLAGLLFWLWRRKQIRKTAARAGQESQVGKELGGNPVAEIFGQGLMPKNEIGGNMLVEVPVTEQAAHRAELG